MIKRVNTVGARERQGRDFRFLNRRKEPYEWTNEVPKDNPDFQGLLDDPAPYPDLSDELPGVPLEDKDVDLQVVSDDPEPDFAELAAAALDNAGINANDCIQAAQQANLNPGLTLIKVDDNEIVYEITFDMPDDGLIADNVVPAEDAPLEDDAVHNPAHKTVDILTETDNLLRQYPTQLRRSVT